MTATMPRHRRGFLHLGMMSSRMRSSGVSEITEKQEFLGSFRFNLDQGDLRVGTAQRRHRRLSAVSLACGGRDAFRHVSDDFTHSAEGKRSL